MQKIQSNQIVVGLFVVLAFFMVLMALAVYVSQDYIAMNYLNPDSNTIVYMAYNALYEHGNFLAWHFGSAPVFIPEIVIIFLLSLLTKNPFHILLAYAAFQIVCITILIPAMVKVATKSTSAFRLGIIFIFIFLTTLVFKHQFGMYDQYEYLAAILSPGFHCGAAILVFILTLLFLTILNNSKLYLKVIFCVLLVLSALSDPFTHVYFTFPMIVTLAIVYFFKQLPRRNVLIYLSLLIGSFITAYVVYHLMPMHMALSFKPSFSMILILDFLKTLLFFAQKNFLWGILWITFMCWAPFSIWQTLKDRQRPMQPTDYIILLQFVTIVVSTPVIILAINQTFPKALQFYPTMSFVSHPIQYYMRLAFLPYRYFINYLLGPIFLGLPLLIYKHFRGIVEKLNITAVFVMILGVFIVINFMLKPHHFHKNVLLHFNSKITVCLLDYAKQYNLTNGITDSYYVANSVTAYSQGKIHLALVDSFHFIPIHWQNTQAVYEYQDYNFAISNSKALGDTLKERFGKPSHTLTCLGDNFASDKKDTYTVYIYLKGKMSKVFKGA